MVVPVEQGITKHINNDVIVNAFSTNGIMREVLTKVAVLRRTSVDGRLASSRNVKYSHEFELCKSYIQTKPGWVMVQDYAEQYPFGHKGELSDRKITQQLFRDAEDKKFAILLIHQYARLGRAGNDASLIVQRLYRLGVQVWSVLDGQIDLQNDIFKRLSSLI
ncbi:recombinase family protein [Paenibacillus sp. YN15]|uniref:recombinase family protein n=1 Tax=Paenibacillus sp. YN15 TaxID=1742774 RepID=UPI0015EC1E0A|nr:recombinase family protein [Paenibacillus sp. YN15]